MARDAILIVVVVASLILASMSVFIFLEMLVNASSAAMILDAEDVNGWENNATGDFGFGYGFHGKPP